MTDRICKYLMENYYSKYKGDRKDIIPTQEQLEIAFLNHSDKFVIIFDSEESKDIIGCAVFLTLSDDTYSKIETYNIDDVSVLTELLKETGNNIHFVLLAARSLDVIRTGIRLVKELKHPKTISWWEPDFSILHKYNLN